MSELPFTPPPENKLPAPPPKAVPVPRPRPVVRRPLVIPDSSKRDTIIALLCGGGVLLLIVFGMYLLQSEKGKPSTNQLTGIIVAKNDSGEKEKEISLGKKGLKSKETDSGFSFTVHVASENRDFEVPVNEGLFRARKIGDSQSFIRPPSEQK
ncbi:MAG TPA: hypothetical protein VGO11_09715 [Chthoniobacteraceae bacterium]|jgi:hypothetical protein|nr:hypothetical protein [Chthoniobacteraceae bacterium]